MRIQLKAWGNGHGIRFTREFLTSAGFKSDDVLNAELLNGKVILSKSLQHRTLTERAVKFDGNLNLSEEISWSEPQGNEVW